MNGKVDVTSSATGWGFEEQRSNRTPVALERWGRERFGRSDAAGL